MMRKQHKLALLLALAAAPAARLAAQSLRPLSADVVVSEGGREISTMRFYGSGLKSRGEMNLAGRTISIVRRDLKLIWVLHPDQKAYNERPLDARAQSGEIMLDFPGVVAREPAGRESVLGYVCTKYRLTVETPPGGRRQTAYVWWADALGMGLKSEVMGLLSEFRNLRLGPQPDSLFEIPPGYQKTAGRRPGGVSLPKGMDEETLRRMQEAMRKRVTGR